VRELVHRHGALLIFDEIVTGFRLSLGGAQQYFGVLPDLACIGKGMGNGYPISAVIGHRDIMEEFDNSFFSFTFGGEAVSIAAAMATLTIMERDNVVSHMWILGRKLKDAYNYLARQYKLEEYTYCQGFPPKASVFFKDQSGNESLLYKSIFQQECVKYGVLFNGHQLNCLMRTDRDIEYTITVYNEAFQALQKAYNSEDPGSLLNGEMINPIFRRVDY
jgi:glutamate-1-semialdehyde 2,1-aminomutase/spore coat polysaccharide biosynthesis protein SpsF